jgi:2-polyprenyl-6-methoxyphenol hydroxylase-like FAD-dependent oxidoreductase
METVQCCIAGGGPAGMVLGLLLARAGVKTLVLEKHADFLRDFRGDTLHPSTLQVMHELGLLEELLTLPHQKASRLELQFEDQTLQIASLEGLGLRCPFIALMPQWDFLDFLARHARQYPNFALKMRAEATELVEEDGRVVGLRAVTADGMLEVRADLVVGADGRHSTVREKSGLEVEELSVPMDVLWFRVERVPGDPANIMGRIVPNRLVVLIDRGSYWQVAYLIKKDSFEEIERAGLRAFQADVRRAVPFFGDRVKALADWNDIKLLTVRVDRLEKWHRPGLVCIGDAAHAMSPLGGVGINLAIQDAVATANILAAKLRSGAATEDDLARVARRRRLPTRFIQRFQVVFQNGIIDPVLRGTRSPRAPLLFRLLVKLGFTRRFAGKLIGVGIRPEHVRSPAA